MKCTQGEMAQLLGVGQRSIRDWQKLTPGLPFTKLRETACEYDAAEVIQWFAAFRTAQALARETFSADDKRMAETREAIARAEQREIDVAKSKGELVEVKDVEATWTALVLTTKRILLNVPHRLAMVMEDGQTYDERKDKARILVEEALKALSRDGGEVDV